MGKSNIIERLSEACATEKGFLAIIKMDSVLTLERLINELNGEINGKADGDKIQNDLVRIIDSSTENYDIKGCIGSNEFVIFYKDMENKKGIEEIYSYIGEKVNELSQKYSELDTSAPVEVSMGAVMVPEQGTNYEELFDKADVALEKSAGKSNVVFYDFGDSANSNKGAMCVDYQNYKTIKKFLTNYNDTYQSVACELTFTFAPVDEIRFDNPYEEAYKEAREAIIKSLRKSDVVTVSANKVFALLPEINMQNTICVINRIRNRFQVNGLDEDLIVNVASQMIGPERDYPVWLQIAI